MERIGAGDLTLKIFEIIDKAAENGFGEREVKLASLRLLQTYRA